MKITGLQLREQLARRRLEKPPPQLYTCFWFIHGLGLREDFAVDEEHISTAKKNDHPECPPAMVCYDDGGKLPCLRSIPAP
tara:strand:- start:1091 stop:1333 length:243 start_codon:yes stop_codon:yes gene_type:complete